MILIQNLSKNKNKRINLQYVLYVKIMQNLVVNVQIHIQVLNQFNINILLKLYIMLIKLSKYKKRIGKKHLKHYQMVQKNTNQHSYLQ